VALKPLPVRRYLRRNRRLGRWLSQADEQARLLVEVRALLPAALAPHLAAVARHGRRLTLMALSPVWASRLRYQTGALVGRIRGIDQVRVKVTPRGDPAPPARPLPPLPRPGPAALANLSALARILDDPRLAARVSRLRAHARPEGDS